MTELASDQDLRQFNTAQIDAAEFDTAKFDAAKFDTVQSNAARISAAQYDRVELNTVQLDAVEFDAAQFDAARIDTAQINTVLSELGRWRGNPLRLSPYALPDLDGVASALALKELLTKLGHENVSVGINGQPQREACWLLNELNLPYPSDPNSQAPHVPTILLDTTHPSELDLPHPYVIGAIDHHPNFDRTIGRLPIFLHRQVGSTATLVTKLFQAAHVAPSTTAATLLYAGLASNTANWNATSTRPEDYAARAWLAPQVQAPESLVQKMFRAKSDLAGVPLYDALRPDVSPWHYRLAGHDTVLAQLEVFEIEALFGSRAQELHSALDALRKESAAERIILCAPDLSCMDTFLWIVNGHPCQETVRLLGICERNGLPYIPGICLRNEIIRTLNLQPSGRRPARLVQPN